jgi:hypothetical protein
MLEEYFQVRESRLAQEKDIRALKRREDGLKGLVATLLDEGAQIEAGNYTTYIHYGGRYPKWKNEFIKRLGEEVAEEIVANTDPRKEVIVELDI